MRKRAQGGQGCCPGSLPSRGQAEIHTHGVQGPGSSPGWSTFLEAEPGSSSGSPPELAWPRDRGSRRLHLRFNPSSSCSMPGWQDPASSSPSGPLCHWGYKRVEGLCLLPLAGWAVGAPRHPHAAPGPSGPFSAPRQAACLSGLLPAQHAEPGMGSPRRARRVSGLTEAGKGCPLCRSAVVLYFS